MSGYGTSAEKEENYQRRRKRIHDAVSLAEPDRVPIAPKSGLYYATSSGISYRDIMTDVRTSIPGLITYLDTFEPDMAWLPAVYPIPPMEAIGPNYVMWPGHGLPEDGSFQVLDGTYVYDGELAGFADDPTHFILTKIIPRRHDKLKGFSKLYLRNPIQTKVFSDFAVFADAEVKEALKHAIECGEEAVKWLAGLRELSEIIGEAGVVHAPQGMQTAPYDMFSDNYRGMLQTAMDTIERPDELEAVLEKMTSIAIERTVSVGREAGHEGVFIPIHGGFDEFMSPANFERFYWKGLKALLLAIINAGMVPYVLWEGNYSTRLSTIADIPKGKAVYMFEKMDMRKAKEVLGDTVCLCGNIPSALLIYGTPDEVAGECKRMLDDCAPGGGFIMDVSVNLTGADPRNLEAMFETTRTYGTY